MNGTKIQLLMIEDDIEYAEIIKMCLDEPDSMGMRFEIERADRLEVGLKLLDAARFDALLLDLTLPDSQGLETIEKVIRHGATIPILVMTNLGDETMAFEAMRLGAQDYMVKATSDSRYLKRAIWYAIERHKLLAQSEGIIKRSADGMVVVDSNGIVRYLNPAAQALFGEPAETMLGKPFPFPLASGETSLQKLSAPRDRTVEMKVVDITWKGAPARLASVRDITELQRVEQLKAEIRERRRLDQLKDELIGTVSHELRTPLTIVKGAIDNLREGIAGELHGKQEEVVQLAHRNVNRLAKMINNLLDLSRLESGSARVSKRPTDPGALINEVLEGFPMTEERRVELVTDAPPGLPKVHADPEMLAQVITNLVDNALRFARSRVTVRAQAVEGGQVLFEIVDDGPGIPEDKLPTLFNKFVQINRKAGGGYKGTGLGLAICKEIMQLHGSKIEVTSMVGAGTRFSFSLPTEAAAATPASGAPGQGARKP
jgi:signal transduction histidine kinase/ActR/RegA family two-component response regulator